MGRGPTGAVDFPKRPRAAASLCHRRRVQVTVEPEALAEWSAHARRTGASLDIRLAALDRDLAPLACAWQGAAAAEFATRHQQWRHSAVGLVRTLNLLASLVETAGGNYRAATVANHRTWHTVSALVVEAMAAGRGRIRANVEDIRTAVRALVLAADDLMAAWITLAAGLTGSAAMAGGDDAGAAFGADYDVMAGAAWQGLRSCQLMVDGIAGGLAATGNNIADAERASTAGATAPFLPITARGAPVPGPAPPPAVGAGAPAATGLAAFWPAADPERLREAAGAWRASAAGVCAAVSAVFTAVDALVAANPDATLAEMRRFTAAALSDDPTSGLAGVLAGTGGRIASACFGLADLTEHTRARIRDTVAHYASDDEWYHPVGDVVDALVRFKPGRFLAGAEDAYLLRLELASIHDEHVRAVAAVRGELHPAADWLARIATATAPAHSDAGEPLHALELPAGTVGEAVRRCSARHWSTRSSRPATRSVRRMLLQIGAGAGRAGGVVGAGRRSGRAQPYPAGRQDPRLHRSRCSAYAEDPGLELRSLTHGYPARDGAQRWRRLRRRPRRRSPWEGRCRDRIERLRRRLYPFNPVGPKNRLKGGR